MIPTTLNFQPSTRLLTIAKLLEVVKQQHPLIHHLTNYVTARDCANVVLALGGSPVMADDLSEVAEMVSMASALVINLGTLTNRTIPSMFLAGKKANAEKIPVILDPVGAGATSLRTRTAIQYLETVQVQVLRGNFSELKSLLGLKASIRGVESQDETGDRMEIVQLLANRFHCLVAMTGAIDFVTDGTRVAKIANGHSWLTRITGAGCMTSSLIGCFCGVTSEVYQAACAGLLVMGLAGEKAYRTVESYQQGIGSFQIRLMDYIDQMTPQMLLEDSKLEEMLLQDSSRSMH
jgi:hydroxyethylthiazole kinase